MTSLAVERAAPRSAFGLKPLHWVLIGILVLALGFGGWSLRGSLARSVTIAEAKQAGSMVQVFGYLYSEGAYDANNNWTFAIQDSDGATLNVVSPTKPSNFENAISVSATGRYNPQTGVFEADQLLLKCPSKYQEQAQGVSAQRTA